ncbi:MAG: hypothetical protein MMC33_000314 [Icmadophila ericetorum]|nr:hypothetical protein [Icmadophila ericetorum]
MCKETTIFCVGCDTYRHTLYDPCSTPLISPGHIKSLKRQTLCPICWNLAKPGYRCRHRRWSYWGCVRQAREDEIPECDHDTVCPCGRPDLVLDVQGDSLIARIFRGQESWGVVSGYQGKGKGKVEDEGDGKVGPVYEAEDGGNGEFGGVPVDTYEYDRMDKLVIE